MGNIYSEPKNHYENCMNQINWWNYCVPQDKTSTMYYNCDASGNKIPMTHCSSALPSNVQKPKNKKHYYAIDTKQCRNVSNLPVCYF